VTHYVSPILQKEAIKIVVKGLIMLKIQSFRKLEKEALPIFIAEVSINDYILLPKWILKNKIIIQHPKC